MQTTYIEETDPFRAIADPNRRQVLDLLAQEPRGVTELAKELNVSQPAVSQQLKILRSAGLVQSTKDGRRQVYSVTGRELEKVALWLSQYEAFWDAKLDGLGQFLKSNSKENPNGND